jgi:hypothetical protein
LAKNLGDLNARLSTIEEKVAQSVAKFPKARALRRTPKVFR